MTIISIGNMSVDQFVGRSDARRLVCIVPLAWKKTGAGAAPNNNREPLELLLEDKKTSFTLVVCAFLGENISPNLTSS